jgi:DNA-binding response OmpR family regulator
MKDKLLLIDDEITLLEDFEELLVIKGYQVDTANSAAEGINKIQKGNYDLVISDLSMPNGDGDEVLNYIRTSEHLINLPFIYLTARWENDYQQKGIENGADDYLTKPITIYNLEKAIRVTLLKRKRVELQIEQKIRQAILSERKIKYHELRTPLFGILSALEFLKSNWEDLQSAQALTILTKAYIVSLGMNKSLTNLQRWTDLSILRIEEKSKIDVKKVISTKINPSERITDNSSSEISFMFSIKYFDFIIDELLTNARKFNSNQVNIEVFLTDTCIKIVNGQDYIEEYGLYVPTPFGQINREKYEQQGLGLGLYLAKFYAEQQDFDLIAVSTESTFEVSLSSR